MSSKQNAKGSAPQSPQKSAAASAGPRTRSKQQGQQQQEPSLRPEDLENAPPAITEVDRMECDGGAPSVQPAEHARGLSEIQQTSIMHAVQGLSGKMLSRARAVLGSTIGLLLPGVSPPPAAPASACAPQQSPRAGLPARHVSFADFATPGPARREPWAGARSEILPDEGSDGPDDCEDRPAAGTEPSGWDAVRAAASTPYGTSGRPRDTPRGVEHGTDPATDRVNLGTGPLAGEVRRTQQHVAEAKGFTASMLEQILNRVTALEQVSPGPALAGGMDEIGDGPLHAAAGGESDARPGHRTGDGKPVPLKNLKPEKFDGSGGVDHAIAWFRVAQRYAQRAGSTMVGIADYLLTGKAQIWWVNLRELYPDMNDSCFEEEFMRTYAKDAAQLRDEARRLVLRGGLVMQAGESVSHYRDRATLLFHKAGLSQEQHMFELLHWAHEGMRANHDSLFQDCALSVLGYQHTHIALFWQHAITMEDKYKRLAAKGVGLGSGNRAAASGSGGLRAGAQQWRSGAQRFGDGKGHWRSGKSRPFGSGANGHSADPRFAAAQMMASQNKRNADSPEEGRAAKSVRADGAGPSGYAGTGRATVAAAVGGSGSPPARNPRYEWHEPTGKLKQFLTLAPLSVLEDAQAPEAAEVRRVCMAAGACFHCYRSHMTKDCAERQAVRAASNRRN